MKRESSDKTRFCVSHHGLSNGLETFCLPCFMFKNKTKSVANFCSSRVEMVLMSRLREQKEVVGMREKSIEVSD